MAIRKKSNGIKDVLMSQIASQRSRAYRVKSIVSLVVAVLLSQLQIAVAQQPQDIQISECNVTFAEKVDVPALDSGPITKIGIEENQAIAADQLVAELDSSVLQNQRIAAEAKRAQLAAKLADKSEMRYAETVHAEAVRTYESYKRQIDRTPGSISQNDLAESRLGVERAQLEIDRLARQYADISVSIGIQDLELKQFDLQLEKLHVRSPLSGVVLKRFRSLGEWVDKGDPIATIARMDQLKVSAFVSERLLSPRRAVGVPVDVIWNEGDVKRTLRGRITSVEPQMFSDSTYRINVMIENHQVVGGWKLTPGRSVTMVIYQAEANPAVDSSATATNTSNAQGMKR